MVFHFPLCVCLLNQTRQNLNLTAFTSKIQVFCRPEWTDQSGTPWKWILTIFKYKNGDHKQSSKSRWKNEVICLISFFPSRIMVLKLHKIMHFFFCKFVLTSAGNLYLLKQFISIHLKDHLIWIFNLQNSKYYSQTVYTGYSVCKQIYVILLLFTVSYFLSKVLRNPDDGRNINLEIF